MMWRHKTAQKGRISFALRRSAEIVQGVFEAPDDPALEGRLRRAGHVPIEEEVATDGAPAGDAERKTLGTRPKKRRRSE